MSLPIEEAGGMLESQIMLEIERGDTRVREEVRQMLGEQRKDIADIQLRLTRHLGGPVLEGHDPDLGDFGRFVAEAQDRDAEQKKLLEQLILGQQTERLAAAGREEARIYDAQLTKGAIEGLRRDVDILKAGQRGLGQRIADVCKAAEPMANAVVSPWGKRVFGLLGSSLVLAYFKDFLIQIKDHIARLAHGGGAR